MQRLDDMEYRGSVQITWNIGGLHFSQEQRVFSRLGSKTDFINVSFYFNDLKFMNPQMFTFTKITKIT